MNAPCVLVHGGAGTVAAERMPTQIAGCERAAQEGLAVLRAGRSALDAAQRAVEVLEDDPNYNAGTGSCLNAQGLVELDASIMFGDSLAAGAVCAMPPCKNPIRVARAVLEEGKHLLYAGSGAGAFATAHGIALVSSEELTTEAAKKRLESVRAGIAEAGWAGGTVGAVAWDGRHLAAATSTGGMVNKAPGRVGDSPLIGAGTYADDHSAAISATGTGEAIIRVSLAAIIAEAIRQGTPAERAVQEALARLSLRGKGEGGVIVLTNDGTPAVGRNTKTMAHAFAALDGRTFSGG